MVKITSERVKVNPDVKGHILDEIDFHSGRYLEYSSVEELLEDWDGTSLKSSAHGRNITIHTYLLNIYSSWDRVRGAAYYRRRRHSGLDVASEVIQKYVQENAEELMALFYLNSETFMELQVTENIKLAIREYPNKNYGLWIEEEGSV